jgi:hypothetical protein
MLTKSVGPTGLYALNATTGTHHATTTEVGDLYGTPGQTLPARKVRIAVTAPACIAFGTDVADNNSDILMPANTVEHFTLQNTNTTSYVLLTGGTAGYISITTIA